MRKNKPSSEKEAVAHQVTATADAFMEVPQPSGWWAQSKFMQMSVQSKGLMRFIKADAVTVGGRGVYSACEEPKYVSGGAFLPANDLYFV